MPTSITYRPQFTDKGIVPPSDHSRKPVSNIPSRPNNEQNAGEGPRSIAATVNTSAIRLQKTAREMQDAVHDLGNELISLENHIKTEIQEKIDNLPEKIKKDFERQVREEVGPENLDQFHLKLEEKIKDELEETIKTELEKMQKELGYESPDQFHLIKRNFVSRKLANALEQGSDMATNVKLPSSSWESSQNKKLDPLALNEKAGQLAEMLCKKNAGVFNQSKKGMKLGHLYEPAELQGKMYMLFLYCPELAEVIEHATKGKTAAVLGHAFAGSPRADIAVAAIQGMHDMLTELWRSEKDESEISQVLREETHKLEVSAGVLGRASTAIKENPSSNDQADAKNIGNWIAKGNGIQTNEAIRYGFLNKKDGVVKTPDQSLLDNWLQVAGIDAASFPSNMPLLLRECGDRQSFSQETGNALRTYLAVNKTFEAIDPRKNTAVDTTGNSEATPLLQSTSPNRIAVDIDQAPMLLPLKYVICGQEDKVSKEVLDILDKAKLSQAFSEKNPELAQKLTEDLNNPKNAKAMQLHRKLVAAELMKTFLEGGSARETYEDVKPYALAGMGVEVLKHFIPDGWGKSAVTELFLGGADMGDNSMGCMAELRSQAKTVKGIDVGGIPDLYEKTFGRSSPNLAVALRDLGLLGLGADDPNSWVASIGKGMGFKAPEGPLASITKTQMQSFLTGAGVSLGMTSAYAAAAGLSSNPAVMTMMGAVAIMGTSISPAIGFGMLHADLTLAIKKSLHDKKILPPDGLDMNNHKAVTKFCHDEAMNQLMMQTGNGAGNIAFLLAPFAASAKLAGFAVPEELVDAFLEPIMPGMENIVRVAAMHWHSENKKKAIKNLKETCINEAAKENTSPMSLAEFDKATIRKRDWVAAKWGLGISHIFVKMLGHSDYPHLVPVPVPNTSSENVVNDISSPDSERLAA